ncbi:MAG: DUF3021 domain-containing protein [Methanobrevibacter sp.]|nr:DUF3021 domain-containing protein [Candidatus Methanovirga aequatorialis]
MNKFLKLTIFGALSGNFILTISTILNVLFGSGSLDYLMNNYIPMSLASMIIGIGFSIPAAIYDHPQSISRKFISGKGISIGRKALIHLTIGFGFAYIGIFYMTQGLNGGDELDLLYSTLFMIVVGFSIWFILYWSTKKESEKINRQLNNIQDNMYTKDLDNQKEVSSMVKLYNLIASIICLVGLLYVTISNIGNILVFTVTTIFLILIILCTVIGYYDNF